MFSVDDRAVKSALVDQKMDQTPAKANAVR
jgi:hypothetical protein